MRGAGRYNFALGAVTTAQGLGASLSGLASGLVVDHFGYRAAFLSAGVEAMVALAVLVAFLPETHRPSDSPVDAPNDREGAVKGRWTSRRRPADERSR
jgi:MFS family permease